MRRDRLVAVLLAAALVPGGLLALAQEDQPTLGAAMGLDSAGASARSAAMGQAGVAASEDASAMFWNPAGLARLRGQELGVHHNTWLADIWQESAAFGLPLGAWGGLGLSLNYINFGAFEARDDAGTLQGSVNADRQGLALGWGVPFFGGLGLGVAARASRYTLADAAYTVLAGDLGLDWQASKALRLGVAWGDRSTRSIGTVASEVRAGLALVFGDPSAVRWTLAGEGDWDPAGAARIGAGLESSLFGRLSLRAGYQGLLQQQMVEGLTGLSAGGGFAVGPWLLDYAWAPQGELGQSHRVSLIWRNVPAPLNGDGAETALRLKVLSDAVAEGMALEEQGRYGEAAAAYQRSVAADPKDLEAWKGLARCYRSVGRDADARRCDEEAAKLAQ